MVTISKITKLAKGKYLIIAGSLFSSASEAILEQILYLNSHETYGKTATIIPINGWYKNPVIVFLDITKDDSVVECMVKAQIGAIAAYDTYIHAIKLQS